MITHFYFKMILVICVLEKGRVWTKILNTVNPKIRHILKGVRNKYRQIKVNEKETSV